MQLAAIAITICVLVVNRSFCSSSNTIDQVGLMNQTSEVVPGFLSFLISKRPWWSPSPVPVDDRLNESVALNVTAIDAPDHLLRAWVYDVLTGLLTGLGVVPTGLITQGLQFTILLASPEELMATIIQMHNNQKYGIVNIFDRVLFGKWEPELLLKADSVQALPGTVFIVRKVNKTVMRIGYHLVDTTSYVKIPFDLGIVYLKTYPEPK